MNRLRAVAPWLAPLALGAVALAATPRSPRAQEDPATLERRVKAAFLYKFASYVAWPASSFPRLDTPVRIGVVGDDALAAELARLTAGRTIERRPVAVQRPGLDDPLDVHMLFVGGEDLERVESHARRVGKRPVLIVTEAAGALARGSMINFVIRVGRVRFEISLPAAEENGLVLRSGLLAVAHSVVPRTP